MYKMRRVYRWLVATAGISTPVAGQTLAVPPAGSARLVTALEQRAAIRPGEAAPVIDRMLALVPIGNEYNVGVSVVRRLRVTDAAPADALVHDAITEVYQIWEGRGVLVTGGTLVEASAFAPDSPVVRTLIGPSSRGTAIANGSAREIGPGDIIVVPPRTPHGFTALHTEEIRYTLIRIDPNRVLQAR